MRMFNREFRIKLKELSLKPLLHKRYGQSLQGDSRCQKMVEDVPSNHNDEDGLMPILDMKVRVQHGIIEHQHYMKPMASKSVIMAASAFTTQEKQNILVNEGNRRLRNHSPHIPWEVKMRDLDTLMIQIQECGHAEEFRSLVATMVVVRY